MHNIHIFDKTDKQLGNVTSVVEYSKIATVQQLGDRIMHIIHLCWRSNFKTSCFMFHQVSKCLKTIKPLGLRPCGFKCFLCLETR